MSGQLPKGADLLADIRRQGYRPSGPVVLYLDADYPRPHIYSDMPLSIEICIKPSDSIDSLALWPLADLDIHVHGGNACNARLRALLKALVGIRPRFIMGGVPAERLIFAWHPQRGWEFGHA